jgi:uncharacterized protein YndB with AHSA1/START domain
MSQADPYSISHTFDAPRVLVFEVNTQPEHLSHWLSPDGFESIHVAMDFKVDGTYHYGLEGPGGVQMWGLQVYREIEPDAKVACLQSFSDQDGAVTRHPMVPNWPLEMLSTTTFEDDGPGRTRLTVSWQPWDADAAGNAIFNAAHSSMGMGFADNFSKLESYLAQLQSK